MLGQTLVSWSSKKQTTVSWSSTEAEYCSLASATSNIIWIHSLFAELYISLKEPSTLWCDNQSEIALARNPVLHARFKHVELDFYFVRDQVKKQLLAVQYVPTTDQLADLLTKPLSSPRFAYLRAKLPAISTVQFQGGCEAGGVG